MRVLLRLLSVKAIEDFFRVYITSSKHEGKLGDFETVIQTRDGVEGLYNCFRFAFI